MIKRLIIIAGVIVLSLFLVSISLAQSVNPEEFLKGKMIDFTSPSKPGGTIYAYITLLTPFLEKYTGASAPVTVRRRGGAMEGYNNVYRSKPDGLSMGAGSSVPILFNYMFGVKGAQWDPAKFNYFGAFTPDQTVLMTSPKGPYQSIEALQAAKNLKFGTSSPRGHNSSANVTVIEVCGLDAKQIMGYRGSSKIRLAIMQGEVAAFCTSLGSALKPRVEVKPLCVLGTKRAKELPNVPALGELVKVSGRKLELLKFWDKMTNSKVWFGPPGMDKSMVEYFRKIYAKIAKDPDFHAKGKKVTGRKSLDGLIIPGSEFQKSVEEILEQKKELSSIFLDLFEKYSVFK